MDFKWPTCGEISVTRGLQCIECLMKRWNKCPVLFLKILFLKFEIFIFIGNIMLIIFLNNFNFLFILVNNFSQGMEDWIFHVEYLHMKCEFWSFSYIYEVLWSVPTSTYPVPQVTVSVYFVLEIYKVNPSSYPVNVRFFKQFYYFHFII